MNYKTRKLIRPEDLNARGTLFGGALLKLIDEEAAIYAMCQLDTKDIVTKLISEVNFMAPSYLGDIIEIGVGQLPPQYHHAGVGIFTFISLQWDP